MKKLRSFQKDWGGGSRDRSAYEKDEPAVESRGELLATRVKNKMATRGGCQYFGLPSIHYAEMKAEQSSFSK